MATVLPTPLKNEITCIRKIKLEGEHGHPLWFVAPLYGKMPKLSDGKPLLTKDFVEKYSMCCEGQNPKHIWIPRDLNVCQNCLMEKQAKFIDRKKFQVCKITSE
jgi:hypothetical protein